MSTTVKIGLYAAGIGLLFWAITAARKKAQEWATKITFKIISFGKPELRSGNLSVPLLVRITNLSPLVIPIDNMVISLSVLKNGMYSTVGKTDPSGAFTITQGDKDITLYPRVDVAKLNPFKGVSTGTNLLTTITNVLSNQNPLLDVKIDADITVQGVTVTETVMQKIYLNQLLNAA